MAGHSHWASIKRKKAVVDSKRGKIFTKLVKEITVAARMGGGDLNGNPRLRTAVAAAKAQSLPADNIDRAIKRGSGGLDDVHYEEITYEGYGPSGVAVIVDVMTDNKIRTVAEIRNIFNKAGGNMGEAGSVAWNFEKKGFMAVDKKAVSEEKLMELALDAGAEDVRDAGMNFEIISEPQTFEDVKKKLEEAKIPLIASEIAKLPKTTIRLEKEPAKKLLTLIDALEDNDDVQHVYSNSDIPEEVLAELG